MIKPRRDIKKRIIKWISISLLSPIVIFFLTTLLLLLPPVQNFMQRQITQYVSKKSGMHITIERVLITPFLNLDMKEVCIIAPTDTLLKAQSLSAELGLKHIFRKKINVKKVTLNGISINTINLIKGTHIEGKLGQAILQSGLVNMKQGRAFLANTSISDAAVKINYIDTIKSPKDTTSRNPFTRISSGKIHLHNVYVSLVLPVEKQRISTMIGDANLQHININLIDKTYFVEKLVVQHTNFDYNAIRTMSQITTEINNLSLYNTYIDQKRQSYQLKDLLANIKKIKYRKKEIAPKPGLDPSFIVMKQTLLEAHSLSYCGRNIKAKITHLSTSERSGITITECNADLESNVNTIYLHNFYLNTPNSEIFAKGELPWMIMEKKHKGDFVANLTAYIGKQDLLLMAGQIPDNLKKNMPFKPLRIKASISGSMDNLNLKSLDAEMPGVASLQAQGVFKFITNKLRRDISCKMNAQLYNTNFLSSITGNKPGKSFTIPNGISLNGIFNMNKNDCYVDASMNQDAGKIKLKANYNIISKVYKADLDIDNVQLHNFLPQDSIYDCTLQLKATGKGSDLYSKYTDLNLELNLIKLSYKKYIADNSHIEVSLHNHQAIMKLSSKNELINMTSDIQATINRKEWLGNVSLNIWDADLRKLGIVNDDLNKHFVFALDASAEPHRTTVDMHSDDMEISMESKQQIQTLVSQCSSYAATLTKQIKEKKVDQAKLKKLLPSSNIILQMGPNNFLSHRINQMKGITFNRVRANVTTSTIDGIKGNLISNELRIKTFQLDTVSLNLAQDSLGIKMNAIANNSKKNNYTFTAKADGYLHKDTARILLTILDENKREGARIGILGHIQEGNINLKFYDDKQIFAFRPFHVNDDNMVSINRDGRVYVNVNLKDDIGTEIDIHSNDSIQYKQFLTLNVKNLNVTDIVQSLPYLPHVGGLLNAQFSYIEKGKKFIVHSKAEMLEASYNDAELGDLMMEATYLPDTIANRHIVFGKLNRNNVEIFRGGGIYDASGEGSIAGIRATVKHFPLNMLESLVPNRMAALRGEVNGQLHAKGTIEAPVINGSLSLDSASAYVPSVGTMLRLDNKQVNLVNNKLTFDNFNIYSSGKNPFTISGDVNIKKLTDIEADLHLTTKNYELVNAKQSRESILFGKLYLNLNSTLTGNINNLKMRGDMRILRNTDITYVLKDSKATVQNRLNSMVSFVNFGDTTTVENAQENYSLGGMDLLLNINIDNKVQAAAFLDPQGNSRVELEGGGNLTMRYTQEEGEIYLTGRYTLTNGLLKYEMPMIPLKDFTIKKGSYVDWTGKMMSPTLNINAYEQVKASVTSTNNSSRLVNFNVMVALTNTFSNLNIVFDLDAPEDLTMKSELSALTSEERSKQAITLLATGMYGGSNGYNVNDALTNILQKEINQVAGSAFKKTNFSIGAESSNNSAGSGLSSMDYSYKFSKKFFNNRVSVVVGGTIISNDNTSTSNNNDSFVNNLSLEYQLDNAGTHYVRLFHNKNYESLLEGEIIETGVGYVLRKNMNRLRDIFKFNILAPFTTKNDSLKNIPQKKEQK